MHGLFLTDGRWWWRSCAQVSSMVMMQMMSMMRYSRRQPMHSARAFRSPLRIFYVFENCRIFIMHCARLRIHTANPLYLLCARVCVCRSGFQMGLEMLTQFGQVRIAIYSDIIDARGE